MKKRIISLFMAFCFMIVMLPAFALASGENGISASEPPTENEKNLSATDSYTANISTIGAQFTVDDTVAVTVNVGGTVGSFASAELTLTYDPNYLTLNIAEDESYDGVHTLNGASIAVNNGTIKIVDHGQTNAYPVAYVLNFTATQATTSTTAVALTEAKFSTSENAISSDLIEAVGMNALNLTIKNAPLKVTLPANGVVAGDNKAPYGENYTFAAKNNTTYRYYNYEVSATMSGQTVTANDNGNGTWTIENVTGDLVISVTETPKTFNVIVKGDGIVSTEAINKVTTSGIPTYMTAFTYTLPANVAPNGTVDGYNYIATVTVNGTSYTASVNGQTYTIVGAAVTGDIVITLFKEVVPVDFVNVTIEGSNEIQMNGAAVNQFVAAKNSQVTLTLVSEVGYTYVINDGIKNLTVNADGTFAVDIGTTAVRITVTKTLDVSSVKVQKYIQFDNNKMMWLVTVNGNGTAKISGKTYGYNGQNMFWSSKYQAYCYLVVAETLKLETAKEAINNTLINANASDVEYDMDVNNSGKVDANDAQLVYDMYQTKVYDNFETVDMIKFLEADLNTTVGVDTADVQVIINHLLNVTK